MGEGTRTGGSGLARPGFDHCAVTGADHVSELTPHRPEPPQTISAPRADPYADDFAQDDEPQEPGVYHGPGPHADDCDCADCLALLSPEWFADYDRYLAEEAARG